MDYQQAIQSKNILSESLLARPSGLVKSFGLAEAYNVSANISKPDLIYGVGIGLRDSINDFYVRVYSNYHLNKTERKKLSDNLKIPIEDLKIVVTDEFLAYNHPIQHLIRPAKPGVSIGHFQITAGTFGCLVTDGTQVYMLSNNHVLANVNNATIGDPILQPGAADGGIVGVNTIALLEKFIPIDFQGSNKVDAALAKPLDNSFISTNFPTSNPQIGNIAGITTPLPNMNVAKYGRTTGLTQGKIVSVNSDFKIRMPNHLIAFFEDQIEIEGQNNQDFSQPGDSGSIILETSNQNAVALLFGGNGTITFANPISTVLQMLNVSIV